MCKRIKLAGKVNIYEYFSGICLNVYNFVIGVMFQQNQEIDILLNTENKFYSKNHIHKQQLSCNTHYYIENISKKMCVRFVLDIEGDINFLALCIQCIHQHYQSKTNKSKYFPFPYIKNTSREHIKYCQEPQNNFSLQTIPNPPNHSTQN